MCQTFAGKPRSVSGFKGKTGMEDILTALYYVTAIVVVILHYTGWLEDRGLEWIVYVIAVLLFPMLYFAYLP